MTLGDARRWLALYFMLTTVVVGLYLLLFAKSIALPMTREDANACFQIVIPVLVGQVAIIFQWIATGNAADPEQKLQCPVPSWAIWLPPLLVICIIVIAAAALIVANQPKSQLSMGPESFKAAITFAVSVLNASTILLVPRLFPKKQQ